MLGTSKSIWGFDPIISTPGAVVWLDGRDSTTMFQDTSGTTPVTGGGQPVQLWKDKSGNSNNVTGTATWSGSNMVFNGTTSALSNPAFVFPFAAYSMFAVLSNTTVASAQYVVSTSAPWPIFGFGGSFIYIGSASAVLPVSNSFNSGWCACINYGRAGHLCIDSSDNVYLGRGYNNSYPAPIFCNATGTRSVSMPSTTTVGIGFIFKYSKFGDIIWHTTQRPTSTGGISNSGVSVDPSNNVFIAGQYTGAPTLFNADGTSTTLPFTGTVNTNYNSFVAKYSSNGTFIWAARGIPVTSIYNWGPCACDLSGSVFISGSYRGNLTLYNSSDISNASLIYTGTTGSNCFIAKYSSTGTVLWAARFVSALGTGEPRIDNITTDPSGNLLATGTYNSSNVLTFYNSNGTSGGTLSTVVSPTTTFIVKYNSTGTFVWVVQRGAGQATGIATDEDGNVFSSETGGNLRKYTPNGVFVWAFSGGNIASIAIARDKSIFIGYEGEFKKLTSNGTSVWSARIATSQARPSYITSIALDSRGDVYIYGTANNSISTTQVALYPSDGTNTPFVSGTVSSAIVTYVAKYSAAGYVFPTRPPAVSNVILSLIYRPSTAYTYVNGDNTTIYTGTTPSSTNLIIGSNNFAGTVSELLIYNTTLSDSIRQAVEGYLSKKWNIQTGLITTQPYYSLPPFTRYFNPLDIFGCSMWLDGGDNSTMNSTTVVTIWKDKSGSGNTVTGSGMWSGSNMVFNGSTDAFCNTEYVFPSNAYSMFAVYSNTTAPAAGAYMNVVYGNFGFPMLGTYDVRRSVTARSVVANTFGLGATSGWVARIGSNNSSVGNAIATDLSGNVVLTGIYSTTTTLFNSSIVSNASLAGLSGNDCFVAKYSSAGGVLWATRISGNTGNENGMGIATDSSGNVLVTGEYSSQLLVFNAPGTVSGATLPYTAGLQCFIAKYSSAGSVTWAAQIASGNSGSSDKGRAIATDSSGNVLVTGEYRAPLSLFNAGGTVVGATLPSLGFGDCFIAKYSPAGSVIWAAQIRSSNGCAGYGIATDSSGNVVVTGSNVGGLSAYNTGGTVVGATLPFTGSSRCDCFVAKYSSAGAVLWAARIAGTSNYNGYGIATDSSGNVLVAGEYRAAASIYNAGGTVVGATLPSPGGIAVGVGFVVKYSSTGTVIWAAQLVGANTATGYGITTDSSGNVILTGSYRGGLSAYNAGGTVVGASMTSSLIDCFVVKYSSTGTVIWATRAGSASRTTIGRGITVDISENVLVTGQFTIAATFFNSDTTTGQARSSISTDVFITKYDKNGYITNTPTPASSNILLDTIYTPSTMSPFINGYAQTTRAGTTLAATGLFVGGPSNYFSGTLSELLIYSTALGIGQRQQVEGYLVKKWGLRSSLIPSHPYLTIPPSTPTPSPYYQTSAIDWVSYWRPYLQSLGRVNSSGVTLSTSNLTGGGAYTTGGWQGAVLSADGDMYCAPYLALNVLNLRVKSGDAISIVGQSGYNSLGGWAGGILGPNCNIYFVPTSTGGIKSLNVRDGRTSNITGGATYLSNGWQGGVLGPDGNMYCSPSNAANILRLTILTNVTSNITGGATYRSSGWSGGVLGPDGNMYCAPYAANNILKLTISTGVTTNITGGATYTANGWYGGVLGPDGNIYFAPHAANNILKLDVVTGVTTNITGGATYTANGWRGAVIGPDGNMYCAPYDANNILKLTISTGVTTNITGGATFTANGWTGGVLAADGNIYFAPYNATNILKLTFTGLNELPSSNYVLSAYANKL